MLTALLLALLPVVFGCGGGSSDETSGEDPSGSAAETPDGGEPVAAFSGLGEAAGLAEGWRSDARLYAVASLSPVDAEGRSAGWLYSYVSEEAGAVRGVAVSGGEARLEPEQGLPAADIGEISRNTLPPAEGLIDSPEAVAGSEEVSTVLRENPRADSAAGLDSFSGGGPNWILSAANASGERVEELVPARTEG